MLKKTVILSVFVFVAGLATFSWVVYDQHKQQEYIEQQKQIKQLWQSYDNAEQQSINPILKSLVKAGLDVQTQKNIESQFGKNERRDMLQTVAILLIASGGGFIVFIAVDCIAKVIIRAVSEFTKRAKSKFSVNKKRKLEIQRVEKLYSPGSDKQIQHLAEKSFKMDGFEKVGQISAMKTLYNPSKQTGTNTAAASMAVMSKNVVSNTETKEKQIVQFEETIKQHFANFQKQIEEVRTIANTNQQTDTDKTTVYDSTLTELTKQVEAINDFAAQQQDRVKRLQEGYDWNIMKNFALRIIRCIDNTEITLKKLRQQNIENLELEQTRDDFLFALESSGIEKYEPQMGSDYRGQEKIAEAMPDRVVCNDESLKGKIAEVVRSGYTYEVGEDNIKVVRNAQVKLYS